MFSRVPLYLVVVQSCAVPVQFHPVDFFLSQLVNIFTCAQQILTSKGLSYMKCPEQVHVPLILTDPWTVHPASPSGLTLHVYCVKNSA